MKTQFFALALSATMIANPLAVFSQETKQAAAKEELSVPVSQLTAEDKVKYLPTIIKSQEKTVEELRATLASVGASIAQIDGIKKSSGDDVEKAIKYGQAIIAAFNGWIATHKDASNMKAYATVAGALLTAVARRYNPETHTLQWGAYEAKARPKNVATIIDEALADVRQIPQAAEVSAELLELRAQVEKQNSLFMQIADTVGFGGTTQDALTALSAISIIVHSISPKLAKYADGVMGKVLPQLQKAKRTGTVSAAGADFGSIAALFLGMNTEEAGKMMAETQLNLTQTKAKLTEEIARRSAMVEMLRAKQ